MLTRSSQAAPASRRTESTRRLVLWLGSGAKYQLAAVDRSAIEEVALPLVAIRRRRSVIDRIRARGLGLFLDPEPWRNQLPLTHSARRRPFSAFDYSLKERVWNPKEEVSSEDLDTLPQAWLSSQIVAGASELLIPGHIYYDLTGRGRQGDLSLARRACEVAGHWMGREELFGDVKRGIYAQITIWPFNLRNRDIAWLADAYSELPVNGYWLSLVAFSQSETQYMGIRVLAEKLQERTGKRVIVSGLGRLWQGALADGVDSVCVGHERSLFLFPSPDLPPNVEEGQRFRIQIYHPAVLGALRGSQQGHMAQDHLFERFPCQCGGHPPKERPRVRRARLHHNAWWIARELEWAIAPEKGGMDTQARIDQATKLRAELGMSSLSIAWREIARREQLAPGGRDPTDRLDSVEIS